MESHERKRDLWYPSDLLGARARHLPGRVPQPSSGRRLTGSPTTSAPRSRSTCSPRKASRTFTVLLAVYLGDDSHWRTWNNLWTAEEDRHGAVLHDYVRDTRLFNQRKIEEMQFEYLRSGFHPEWDRDPYRVFAYTTVQERATQFSHSETGRIVSEYEPRLGEVLAHVAKDEARHYAFYRSVFEEILKRDPDQALHSASFILPAIDMPGVTMPGFKELADVIRRAGIYGPRDYLRIVQEQIRYWKIEKLQGLGELGRIAQEKILGIPARLQRIAEHMETRSRAKTFSFEVVFNREFAME